MAKVVYVDSLEELMEAVSFSPENGKPHRGWATLFLLSWIAVLVGFVAIIGNGAEYVLNIFDFFDFPIEENQSEQLAWSLVAALLFMHIGNFAWNKMR